MKTTLNIKKSTKLDQNQVEGHSECLFRSFGTILGEIIGGGVKLTLPLSYHILGQNHAFFMHFIIKIGLKHHDTITSSSCDQIDAVQL